MITIEQIATIMPYGAPRAGQFADAFSAAMQEFGIRDGKRAAAFVAQVAHETGELRYMRELADGLAYEPSPPGAILNKLAVALGNIQQGDGPRYKGGGGLMLTGRTNYDHCGRTLGIELLANPALIVLPLTAMRTAGWFWTQRGCNDLADGDSFFEITHRINGGYNGGDSRLRYYLAARRVYQL